MFILSVGRKNAKTVFGAFLLLLHTVGPEAKRNSQLYSDAQSRDQAAILFHYAAKIVRLSPTLNSFVTIRDTAKELVCSELGTKYKALSAEASTAYGLSPAFALHDELGQVKGPRSELYDAIESAMGAQESPLSVVISTQAPTEGDLLSILIDDAAKGTDPRIKVALYTADPDAEPFALDTIKQANPHLDLFMNRDEVLAQAEKAKRLPSMEASFRNLILNQRVEANDPFVPKSVWDANGAAPEMGEEVYGGLDLSSVHDLTSLELVDAEGNVESHFWLPEDGIAEKSRKDRVPYDLWAEQGFLTLCPGKSVDYEWLAFRMREVFDTYAVKAIAFDRWNMRHLLPYLERAGFSEEELERFVPFGQGFKDMSPALRATESMLLNEQVSHGMHPVLRMCAANAVVQQDPAGNRKLAKDKSSGRIDGMVALAMAIGVMTQHTEEKPLDIDSFLNDTLMVNL
jgi:phage terminase large subunit-like protein